MALYSYHSVINIPTTLTLSMQDPTDYENWKHANWPTLAETLADFPSIEADAPFILCNLPMMQARSGTDAG